MKLDIQGHSENLLKQVKSH